MRSTTTNWPVLAVLLLLLFIPTATADATTSLSDNTSLSIVAPYIGEYVYNTPSSGTNNFYGLNYGTCTRVRQNGQIVGAQFALSNTGTLNRFQICVWRQNDTTGNFTLIDKSEDVSGYITSDGIQNVLFSTPLEALEGDFIGWECDASSAVQTTSTSVGSTTDSKIYWGINHVFSETDEFDFINDATYTTNNKIFRIGVFMDAVDWVFIGDSVVSGRPYHTSYVDPSTLYQPNSSMAYQFGLIAGDSYQNMGWRSTTSTQIRARFISDVIDLNPDYVFIEGGLNDWGSSIPPTTTLSNLCWMANTSASAGIETYLCEIPPSTGYGDAGDWQDWQDINDQLHTIYDNSESVTLIPIRNYVGKYYVSGPSGNLWTIKDEFDPGDHLHYNVAGYMEFANIIYNTYTSQNWYNPLWSHSIPIIIDCSKVEETQTNFPVYIDITSTTLRDNAQADGDDILFTSLNNYTKLSHEIENYDSATGHLRAFVNVTYLSEGTDTTIFCYCGNSGASNQEDAEGVWDTQYKAVYHLNDAAIILDSTSNDNDGTNSGATLTESSVDYGLSFDGTNDWIDIISSKTDFDIGATESYTILSTYTIEGKEVGKAGALLATGDRSSGVGYDVVTFNGSSTSTIYARTDNSSSQTQADFAYSQTTNIRMATSVFNRDDSTQKLYIDSTLRDTDSSINLTTFGAITPNPHNVYIGKYYFSYNNFHSGYIGEVWFIKDSLSSGTIETLYNTLLSPSTFLTVGDTVQLIDDTGYDFSNFSMPNITDYDRIMNFTNMSSYESFFVPVTEVWITTMSGWFWIFIILLTSGVTLIKSRSLFPTSLVMLLLSAVMILAVPAITSPVLYLLMVLGVLGCLFGIFGER